MTAQSVPRVGWVGVGRMGSALVERLLQAGVDVTVWNRTREKTQPLEAAGAHVAESIVDLSDLDVVFTTVSTPADVLEVTSGPGGLFSAGGPKVLVDCSTISATVSARVRAAAAQRGADFLACGMSGNHIAVRKGNACFAVSGPSGAYDYVKPLFDAIARQVVHVGEREESRLVKLAYNLFLAAMTEGLAEVLTFAEGCGIQREKFLQFFNQTHLACTWIQNRTPALVNHDWAPTFTTTLLLKDIRLGLAEADQRGTPLPTLALIGELVQLAVSRGLGGLDILALTDAYAPEMGAAT